MNINDVISKLKAIGEELVEVELLNEAEFNLAANIIANQLEKEEWVLLNGPLGSGKTTFARTVIHHFGWQKAVRSPTFNLINIYSTKPPIAHADLYRTQNEIGADLLELFEGRLCLIEWPVPIQRLASERPHWKIDFFIRGEGRRMKVSRFRPK